MTHDKFCRTTVRTDCQCEVIAAVRADEREQAAQRLNRCRTDLRGCVNKAPALAAVLGMDEPRPPWTTPADVNKWAAAARGDVADKTGESTGGHGGLVSRASFLPSSAATVHNIDDPDAIVNIKSADTVNITEARAVNLGGFIGIGEPWIPSHSHVDECKQWIMSRAIPENAPCICSEVKAAYERGREDAAKAVGEILPFETHWLAQHEAVDAAAGVEGDAK